MKHQRCPYGDSAEAISYLELCSVSVQKNNSISIIHCISDTKSVNNPSSLSFNLKNREKKESVF